ncbi:hypothetical protein IT570_11855 [Candidatus Sumerlaeota bacterium]|nr:hypothetical protein [Candidatus Sumerlaeota bacterium]
MATPQHGFCEEMGFNPLQGMMGHPAGAMDLRKFVDKIRDLGRKDDEAGASDGGDLRGLDGQIVLPGDAPPMESHSSASNSTNAQRPRNSVYSTHMGDSFYAQRQEHVNRVREMFGEFGSQVSSYILTQSLTEGGVGRIIIKLGLVTRGRDGADLAQIENWILKNSVEAFHKAVGLRAPGAGASPPRDNRPGVAEISVSGDKSVGVTVRTLDDNEDNNEIRNALRLATPRTFPARDTKPRPATHTQKVSVQPVNLNGAAAEEESSSGAPDAAAEAEPDIDVPQVQREKGFPFAPKV